MIKIFGYNILTDKELKQREQNHWERVKDLFKIKKFYKVYCRYTEKPKCNFCDDDRKLTITCQDGVTRKVDCSCNKLQKHYVVKEYGFFDVVALRRGKIIIADTEYGYFNDWTKDLLTTKKEVDNLIRYKDNIFTSKKLAQYYANKLNKELKND